MADKYLTLVNNQRTEREATVVSTGVAEAGDLLALDANGKVDLSVLPTGVGPDVSVVEATENLTAGDYVNIYDSTGPKCRKADASAANAGKIARGFVLTSVTMGQNATIYHEGANDQLSGLTPGVTYALSHSTPGGAIALASATTTAGHSLQILGYATSATTINTEIEPPVIRG